MRKIIIGLILGMVVLFTACVSEGVNVPLNVGKKENKVREVATIDISQMPIQTYEEYIKLKKFVLEKYIKEANSTRTSGVAYLSDGTKIEYSFDKSEVAESIFHLNKPFVEIQKIYYTNSKSIKYYMEFLSNLDIGKTMIYNQFREITKVYDEDAELRALGLDYKKILEWADEHEIIDFKEARMLKGNRFELQKLSFEKHWKSDWSKEEEKYFQKKHDLSDRVTENFFSHSHYWAFSVDFPRYQDEYIFSADGSFVQYLGKVHKLDGLPAPVLP